MPQRKVVRNMPYSIRSIGTSGTIVSSGAQANLKITSGSMGGWVKLDQRAYSLNANKRIFSLTTADADRIEIIDKDQDGRVIVPIVIVGGVTKNSTGATVNLMPYTWNHFVWAWDASGAVLYVNSKIVYTTATDCRASFPSNPYFYFNKYVGAAGYEIIGNFGESFVYSTKLTASQISDIYYNGIYPSTGQQLLWRLSDGTGTSITDSSPNGYTGTITGLTWSKDTLMNQRSIVDNAPHSLAMNGSTGYVTVADNAAIRPTSFSLDVWMKDLVTTQAYTNYVGIVTKTTGVGWADGWGLSFINASAPGSVIFWQGSFLGGITASPSYFNRFGWNHIIISYDNATTTSTMYLNGKKVGTRVAALTQVTASLMFGAGTSGGAYPFRGNLSRSRLFNRAITDTEAGNLYYGGILPTTPVASWGFTDGTGSTLTDSVGGYNGTITTPVWSTDSPMKNRSVIKNYPHSLLFSGTAAKNVSMSANATYAILTGGMRFRFKAYRTQKSSAVLGILFGDGTDLLEVYFHTNNVIQLYNYKGSAATTSTTKSYNDEKWHECFVTWVDNGIQRIYIDGLLEASGASKNRGSWVGNPSFYLGAYVGSGYEFQGELTDVSLYNGTITAQDVADVYYNKKILSTEVSNWGMTDGSGTTLTLTRGSGGNGTLTATDPSWTADSPMKSRSVVGSIPYSTYFNAGSDKYISLGSHVGYKITTGGFRCRFKHDTGTKNPGERLFTIYIDSSNEINVGMDYSNSSFFVQTTGGAVLVGKRFDDNKWHEAFLVITSTTTFKLYIDGLCVYSGNLGWTVSWASNPTILIGHVGWTSGAYTFKGWITDFSIYSGSVSAQDVSDVFYNGKVLSTEVANWGMTDGTGTTLTLTRGTGNNGTLTASNPTWSSDAPMKQRSIVKTIPYSLVTNGTTGYFNAGAVPDYSFIQNTGIASMGMWVKIALADILVTRYLTWTNTDGTQKGFEWYRQNDGKLVIVTIAGGSVFPIIGTTSLALALTTSDAGKWVFLGCVINSTTTGPTFYIGRDGRLLKETVTNTGSGSYPTGDSGAVLNVGGNGKMNFQNMFIHNTALTTAQMQSIFYNGIENSGITPYSWWKGTEGTGTSIADSGSAGKNGTIVTPVWSADAPF